MAEEVVSTQEVLTQLQSHVSAWKEECQSVSLEELWQLHATANDFGADAEALRLLGLDIISLEAKFNEVQKGDESSQTHQAADASLEQDLAATPVLAALPEKVSASPLGEHTEDDKSVQDQLCPDSNTIQAKPECNAEFMTDAVMAAEADQATGGMTGTFSSEPQGPATNDEALSETQTVLKIDYAVQDRPSRAAGLQPQATAPRWFPCSLCSRRSQQPPKRKAEEYGDELGEPVNKYRKQ